MQVVALPYCDLVLISTNAITAILFNTFLSIKFLGEKFIWQFDVPAFTLMGAGGVIIVLMASADDKKYTADEIKGLLTTAESLVCTFCGLIFLIGTLIYLRIFLKQIAKFETDIENWVKEQQSIQKTGNSKSTARNSTIVADDEASLDNQSVHTDIETETISNQLLGKELPRQIPRVLIQILCIFPRTLVNEVSPRSECIRKSARMPMLFLLVCSGLLGGYSVTLFKLLGELFVGKAYKTNVFLTFALLAVGLLANLLQLLFLNISMRYYDQLDVVPIFMTSYLVFSIGCGLVFLDESAGYTGL